MGKNKVEMGSRNIFADIGDAEPERTLARAQVMNRIATIIQDSGFTQAEAARTIGISQSRISKLVNGKLDQFSLDQLINILNKLDRDVEIVIKPRSRRSKKKATVKVVLAA